MHLAINGQHHTVDVDLRASLLDVLREQLHMTGTKLGCNQGACGACTVLVDGHRILSCLALAVQYQGRAITTIEGLSDGSNLHALQAAFVEHDGLQCGYCTPGQICSAIGMAAEFRQGLPSAVTPDGNNHNPVWDREEIRERMSGNLCRCGAHNGIIHAIEQTLAEAAQ